MAASPAFQTVFQIGVRSFPWSAFLNPSLCILLGIAFYRIAKRQALKAFGSEATIVGGLFFSSTSSVLFQLRSSRTRAFRGIFFRGGRCIFVLC